MMADDGRPPEDAPTTTPLEGHLHIRLPSALALAARARAIAERMRTLAEQAPRLKADGQTYVRASVVLEWAQELEQEIFRFVSVPSAGRVYRTDVTGSKLVLAEEFALTAQAPEPVVIAEQEARDLLERLGYADAQQRTAGDLVELANLIARASAR